MSNSHTPLEVWRVMSMPTSRMASMANGWTLPDGIVPALKATTLPCP
jgi:hypothetical protein